MRFLLSSANVPLTIHSKATELIWSKGSCKYRHTYLHKYIHRYVQNDTDMNEWASWMNLSPALAGGLFHWQVGHISVAYFFFSRHQYLFLFLFYRIVMSWLSYSVSVWSLDQHVSRFSAAIAHVSSFWCFGNLQNHPVSVTICASLLIANSKSVLNIKSWRHHK